MAASLSILDASGAPMKPHATASVARPEPAYTAASIDHPALGAWIPGTYSGRSSLSGGRSRVVNRIHDIARNDGWASTAVTRLTDNVIGSGWRLSAKPNAACLACACPASSADGTRTGLTKSNRR